MGLVNVSVILLFFKKKNKKKKPTKFYTGRMRQPLNKYLSLKNLVAEVKPKKINFGQGCSG